MYIKVTTHNSPPSYRLPQKIHHNYTIIHSKYFSVSDWLKPGAYPGTFLGGGALVSCSTSTPINHIFFFLQNTSCIRKPQVISGGGGGGGVYPCTLPRSAPKNAMHDSSLPTTVDQIWKNFVICELMMSIMQQNCHIIELLTEKTWGSG